MTQGEEERGGGPGSRPGLDQTHAAHMNACLSSIQHLSPTAVDDSRRLATRLRCVNVEVKIDVQRAGAHTWSSGPDATCHGHRRDRAMTSPIFLAFLLSQVITSAVAQPPTATAISPSSEAAPSPTSWPAPPEPPNLIGWEVGQGPWTTAADGSSRRENLCKNKPPDCFHRVGTTWRGFGLTRHTRHTLHLPSQLDVHRLGNLRRLLLRSLRHPEELYSGYCGGCRQWHSGTVLHRQWLQPAQLVTSLRPSLCPLEVVPEAYSPPLVNTSTPYHHRHAKPSDSIPPHTSRAPHSPTSSRHKWSAVSPHPPRRRPRRPCSASATTHRQFHTRTFTTTTTPSTPNTRS